MFKVLVLQTLYTLSDDQTEYQLKDRLSFMRFIGLALHDPVPDAKTIWLYREQLARAGATERLFARFDALLRAKGWLAMGGQIPGSSPGTSATVIEARRPRLTQAEKGTIKGGGVPAEWKPARRAQIDRDGRWTIKRGRKRETAPGDGHKRQPEIAVPVFGYKNHIGIDREHGFLRRYAVAHAAAHDGSQLDAVLDPDNTASQMWADAAHRSAANLALLDRRGLKPQFQRKSRAAGRCRRTSPAATPPAPGCARASSTSSPPRNAGLVSSCAPSAWCAPGSKSASPISPTTSPASPGSRRRPRMPGGNPPQAMVKPNKPMPARRQSARKSLRPIRLAPQILAQPGSSRCPSGTPLKAAD